MMTEGSFFSEHDGFPPIETMLEQDKVDERGKTIRLMPMCTTNQEMKINLTPELKTATEAINDQGVADTKNFSD